LSAYWPQGIPASIDYPEQTLAELHTGAAALYADRTALIDGEQTLTYARLHQRAAALANALRANGIGEGDVVLLHLANSIWFPISYFGTLLAGAAVSLANPLEPPPALHRQLLDTGAKAAVTHPAHAAALREARTATSARTLVVVPPTACAPSEGEQIAEKAELRADELVEVHSTTPPEVVVGPEDLAHLAYTGGTTGVPKGVRVLHRNVVANTAQMTAWRAAHLIAATGAGRCELRPIEGAPPAGVRPGEGVSVVVSPLYHAHALVNMNFLLMCGTTLVLSGRFSSQELLKTIEEHRATYLTGSPTMWHQLLNCPDLAHRDLSSPLVLSSGAAPIDRTTLEALQAAFPSAVVAEGYGQTEATCVITASPVFRGSRRKPGSVGLPVVDTEVEVRSPADELTALPANEVGELWVRGPQVSDGYLGHPEATAHQFVDGWLRTGDLGYLDEDGFVFIVGRSKDMLIYKGYNVYPRELEEVLCAHPDVDSAAVVGREDSAVGEEPFAFVVARAGTVLSVSDLKEFVAARVLPYKKVRHVEVVEALPTTAAGKITKAELRERANTT
jgi:long-chain acyl-CoA synthetase